MKHILYPDGAVLNMMVTGKMKRGMEIIHSSISGHVDDGDWVSWDEWERKQILPDSQVYDGDWKNEKTNGKGKCEYSNGQIYVVFTSLSVDEFCTDSNTIHSVYRSTMRSSYIAAHGSA